MFVFAANHSPWARCAPVRDTARGRQYFCLLCNNGSALKDATRVERARDLRTRALAKPCCFSPCCLPRKFEECSVVNVSRSQLG